MELDRIEPLQDPYTVPYGSTTHLHARLGRTLITTLHGLGDDGDDDVDDDLR